MGPEAGPLGKLARRRRWADDRTVPDVSAIPWRSVETTLRLAIRWLSLHTGLPALVVAAVLLVLGFRLVKRSARFTLEVVLVAALLVAATSAGWIRW